MTTKSFNDLSELFFLLQYVVTSNKKNKKWGHKFECILDFFSNLVSWSDFGNQNLARKLQLMHFYRKCMNNVLHLRLSCLPFSIPISQTMWENMAKTIHWHVLFVVKTGLYLTFHFEMDKDIFLVARQAPVQRLML